MTKNGPLSGIKIIDLTKLAPGPHCTMILGDLGADIIKVEEPGPPTGRRAQQAEGARIPTGTPFSASPFNALNRNKKSIALNLKTQVGKEIFLRLAQRADIVVEEYRPGVAKRLGIDFDVLSARNPKLIYCAVTGYGQNGPYKDRVGHDLNYIATAGALSIIGRADQPPTIPHNFLADYAGGGMHAAIGVLAALVARQTTGRGQMVDIAMLDGVMLLMAQAFSEFYAKGKVAERGKSIIDGQLPHYSPYLTKDNQYVTVGSIEPWFYANLCRALGHDEFIPYEFDKSKFPEIRRTFEQTFKTKTRGEWVELMSKTDICVAPMYAFGEVAGDPHIQARKMVVEVDGSDGQKIKQVGVSVKMSETPGSIRTLAPRLGQHTDEILGELGYTTVDIGRWRGEGAIK